MNKLKVLIPVDFSEQSDFAIRYAENFKDKFDLEILLLHVLEISGFADVNSEGHFEDLMGINTEMLEIQQQTAMENMTRLSGQEKNEFKDLSSHIKLGPLTETIVAFAENRKVDMILMGTKGGNNLKSWFSGSDTQIVARRSEIPVLSVMCERSDAQIDHLLFISDFKDIDLAPDPVVTMMAEAFNAKLHLLCISAPDEEDESIKRKCIEEYAKEHHLGDVEIHIHRDKNIIDGVNHFEAMDDMDMIALGSHGRKGIRHLIRGSIAEKLINQLYKPVLVYKI